MGIARLYDVLIKNINELIGVDAATAKERRDNPDWSGLHVTSLTRFDIKTRKGSRLWIYL